MKAALVVVSGTLVVACGQVAPAIDAGAADGESASWAAEFCRDEGSELAEGMSAGFEGVAAVFESTAGDVARWAESHSGVTSRFRAHPSGERMAVCYFDADIVYAPGGPAPPEGESPLPPYTQLVVTVTADGEARPFEAIRAAAEGDPEPEGPPDSRRVDRR